MQSLSGSLCKGGANCPSAGSPLPLVSCSSACTNAISHEHTHTLLHTSPALSLSECVLLLVLLFRSGISFIPFWVFRLPLWASVFVSFDFRCCCLCLCLGLCCCCCCYLSNLLSTFAVAGGATAAPATAAAAAASGAAAGATVWPTCFAYYQVNIRIVYTTVANLSTSTATATLASLPLLLLLPMTFSPRAQRSTAERSIPPGHIPPFGVVVIR